MRNRSNGGKVGCPGCGELRNRECQKEGFGVQERACGRGVIIVHEKTRMVARDIQDSLATSPRYPEGVGGPDAPVVAGPLETKMAWRWKRAVDRDLGVEHGVRRSGLQVGWELGEWLGA
jgi:hypothetical protein